MKCELKRLLVSLACAIFFCLMGFGIRHAEANQVGYTNDTSMWVFVVSGLFAYYAAIVLFKMLLSRKRFRAIVSLGSNIEPRAEYLSRAEKLLSEMPSTKLVVKSAVSETEPVDVPQEFAGMKFLNQLIVFETGMEVHEFSQRMHEIEDELGRVRVVRNGPRTIDIDLIDFGGIVCNEHDLKLPHPRAASRDFVMRPLRELGIVLFK